MLLILVHHVHQKLPFQAKIKECFTKCSIQQNQYIIIFASYTAYIYTDNDDKNNAQISQ